MSAMTDAGRRGLAGMERLLDALTDPARRERTVVAVLVAYVGLWTLYAALAKGSQDIHADMSEQFVLARELALGYPKHPPLAMAGRAGLVHRVSRPRTGPITCSRWRMSGWRCGSTWRLSARFLDGEKRVVGLGASHSGAVLQFSRPQVQREHGADAGVGGDDALVPAVVRDPAPARRRARRPGRRRWPCTANTGRSSCCSGSALPRSRIRGAPPISARPRPG